MKIKRIGYFVLYLIGSFVLAVLFNQFIVQKYFYYNDTISEPIGWYLVLPVKSLEKNRLYAVSIDENKLSIIRKFGYNANTNTVLKRLAGIPGDTVDIQESALYINNILVSKNKLLAAMNGIDLKPLPIGKYLLESNEYFFIGQSAHSYDSRYFGFIRYGQVQKRAIYVSFLPTQRFN